MSSPDGVGLSKAIRQKVEELNRLCDGIDEATASRAPTDQPDRWSPKQVISHLCGPEGAGITTAIRAFLEQDTPLLDMTPADPYFTDKRARMTFVGLMSEFKAEYGKMADLVAGLSAEQLARKAQIPMLKESPLGEYPTLATFAQGIAEHHIGFHIDHMRQILKALGHA